MENESLPHQIWKEDLLFSLPVQLHQEIPITPMVLIIFNFVDSET